MKIESLQMVDYPRVLLVADRALGQKERAIALFLWKIGRKTTHSCRICIFNSDNEIERLKSDQIGSPDRNGGRDDYFFYTWKIEVCSLVLQMIIIN